MMLTPDRKRGWGSAIFSRILHTYFLMARGLTIGVRAVVRSDDGKFLLVRHTYTTGWHFPGGGVEKDQTTTGAVCNELQQETGLTIVGQPVLYGVYHNRSISRRDHVLVYLCEVEGSISEKQSSMEIAEIGYFHPDHLPEGIDPGTQRRIFEIVKSVDRSVSW